jgi:hypothetical protein
MVGLVEDEDSRWLDLTLLMYFLANTASFFEWVTNADD